MENGELLELTLFLFHEGSSRQVDIPLSQPTATHLPHEPSIEFPIISSSIRSTERRRERFQRFIERSFCVCFLETSVFRRSCGRACVRPGKEHGP